MRRMEVQAVFVVVILTFAAATTTDTKTEKATFSGKKVTLTCPEEGDWFDNEKKVSYTKAKEYTLEYTRQVQFSCKFGPDDKKNEYKFYIKGRACENCFELDGHMFLAVLSVDLTATSLLMIIIYRCNKKSTSDAPARPSKAPVRSGGMAPPDSSSQYESLNLNTRSADTYSTVVNRMG